MPKKQVDASEVIHIRLMSAAPLVQTLMDTGDYGSPTELVRAAIESLYAQRMAGYVLSVKRADKSMVTMEISVDLKNL